MDPAVKSNQCKSIERKSYIAGMITAFAECVANECKKAALSPPFYPQDYDKVVSEAERIAQEQGVFLWFDENQDIPEKELIAAIRDMTLKVKGVPVMCGASFKNKGVQLLLDAVVNYLPSPLDVPPAVGANPSTEKEETRNISDDEAFSGLIFKITTDPFVGKLCYLRIYSGKLSEGNQVLNTTTGKKDRISKILEMHANNRVEIDEAYCGDIVSVVGLRDIKTGDTICNMGKPIRYESISFPEPVISIAIEPKTKVDQDKLSIALNKIADEDPTFKISYDSETGQTIISGMGELHLEIIVDRLLREFKVSANVGRPQVSYRETITRDVEVEGKYIRQSGGRGQYGHVVLHFYPNEYSRGFEFEDKTKGGIIPKEFIKPVEMGIVDAMQSGELAGYPVVDIKAVLLDGSYHEVDSSDLAFRIAGGRALREAVIKGAPILLEPVMDVEVVVPDEFLGDVIGDLNSRRGKILNVLQRNKVRIVKSEVPLESMFGYATDLRSKTQGRATFTMLFKKYEPVPDNVANDILHKVKGTVAV